MANDLTTVSETPLDPAQPLGARFAGLGIPDLRAAAGWVAALPYGRTSDRADYRLVLTERRGACSTKHALVAALAAEVGAPLTLQRGLFEMTAENTPAVGEVLRAAGLDAVPELHCWIQVLDADGSADGTALDLTWPGAVTAPPAMLWTETIQPWQIGADKVARHHAAVGEWAAARGLDAPQVWAAREACIAALSRGRA